MNHTPIPWVKNPDGTQGYRRFDPDVYPCRVKFGITRNMARRLEQYRVIDGRYQAMLPVVLTTNLVGDHLAEHFGAGRGNEATWDRLREMCGEDMWKLPLRATVASWGGLLVTSGSKAREREGRAE